MPKGVNDVPAYTDTVTVLLYILMSLPLIRAGKLKSVLHSITPIVYMFLPFKTAEKQTIN